MPSITIRSSLAAGLLAVSLTSLASVALTSAPALAQVAKPSALDLLFENKHIANLPVGQKLAYRFSRTVTKPELLGQPFADDVTVDVRKVATDGTREVDVRVFTGERARDPQVIDGLTGNPILVVFLDRSVASYMALAGGKIPYLKERFRSALRDRAVVEAVKVKVGEQTVDATRVSVTPYAGDPNAAKMQGYENSRFSIVVSEAVPGHFIELVASFQNNNKDAPGLEERLIATGMEVLK